ncbi:MAG: alpha/beta fold hydrolase [Acidimicrobiales bacterium]
MGQVVLVHGAWHGAWCWDQVVDELTSDGIASVAVELPFTSYEDDVATARAAIESAGEGSVVCGHSYGGLVITQAAAGLTGIRRLVYLSAFQAAEEEEILSLLAQEPSKLLEAIVFSPEGVTVDPGSVHEVFYGDSDASVAASMATRLRPMPSEGTAVLSGRPAWRDIASTYIVCTNDQAVAPTLQRRLAERSDEVVEWDTDHSAFLTRPKALADLLASYLR